MNLRRAVRSFIWLNFLHRSLSSAMAARSCGRTLLTRLHSLVGLGLRLPELSGLRYFVCLAPRLASHISQTRFRPATAGLGSGWTRRLLR